MRFTNPRDYVVTLGETFENLRKEYTNLQDSHDREVAGVKNSLEDDSLSPTTKAYLKERYEATEQQLNTGLKQLRAKMDTETAAIRADLVECLDTIYQATPDKLDSNTIALLNTGVMTGRELARLADENRGNPVMLRIIASHAKALTDDRDARTLAAVIATKPLDGSKELSAFDGLAYHCRKGLHDVRAVADHVSAIFEDHYNSALESM